MNEQRAWYRAPEGWGSVRYEDDRILEIELPRPRGDVPSDIGRPPHSVRSLVDRLTQYFAGEREEGVSLPAGLQLDWSGIDGFRARVYEEVSRIPAGQTRSYADVAAAAGNPRAARAVGTAMATNPFPIVVPCHRVVRADGSLGEFGGGVKLKERMLTIERGDRD